MRTAAQPFHLSHLATRRRAALRRSAPPPCHGGHPHHAPAAPSPRAAHAFARAGARAARRAPRAPAPLRCHAPARPAPRRAFSALSVRAATPHPPRSATAPLRASAVAPSRRAGHSAAPRVIAARFCDHDRASGAQGRFSRRAGRSDVTLPFAPPSAGLVVGGAGAAPVCPATRRATPYRDDAAGGRAAVLTYVGGLTRRLRSRSRRMTRAPCAGAMLADRVRLLLSRTVRERRSP